jgi:hypothetical protein
LLLTLAFCAPGVAAVAQIAGMPDWAPIGRAAQLVTGRVSFTSTKITFQNGTSLVLTPGGQMLFRPEPKKKKVMADLYRVTPPGDPVLENGNRLCKGKPVAYLIVWKPERVGAEVDPRTFAVFSGQKFDPGSPDDCGRYTYDAGTH